MWTSWDSNTQYESFKECPRNGEMLDITADFTGNANKAQLLTAIKNHIYGSKTSTLDSITFTKGLAVLTVDPVALKGVYLYAAVTEVSSPLE